MTSQRSVVFAEPVRTAIGTFGGSLKDVPAPTLGSMAIGAAVARAKLRPEEVETVVMGNVVQAGTKMNPARQAAVHAGLPVTIPALTVNRVCGSGAQAIVSAAQEISLGNINVAVAGGMENMDQAPYLIARGRWGYRMGDGALYDSVLRDGLNDAFSDAHSGWHTEDLVEKYQVTREAQDRWALRFAGRRSFQIADRAGGSTRQKGTDAFRQGRAQPARHDARNTGAAQAGIPSKRHNHRRQRPRTERCRFGLGARRWRVGRQTRSCHGSAPSLLRHRCGRTGHVRTRTGAGSPASIAAGRLGHSFD